MAKRIRVPWVQWRRFRVTGVVREQETGRPLAGLRVQAFDEDLRSDDFLGECSTDADGRFKIHFRDADFKDFVESRPDLYLLVKSADESVILDTSCEVRQNASEDEYYELTVPRRDSSSAN
jgi:hypothetical protein